MKTITKSACLNMKTKTNTLLGAVLFLLVIGASATIANAQDGTLVSWGDNSFGQRNGMPLGTFTTVDAYDLSSVAMKTDGTLVSWGSNAFGLVSGTPAGTFSAASAGASHSVAIRQDGTLVSWGRDPYGEVSGTPVGTFTVVSAGAYHTVAIRTDGTLVSWGSDQWGQVSGTPAGTFTAVDAGYLCTTAIRTDGTLVSWGYVGLNFNVGQVTDTPAGTFSAVAVSNWTSAAIRTDGTLVSWGSNEWGQVSGTPGGTFSAVAVGPRHSIAIRTDGTLVSWGSNAFGLVSNTPAGTFTAVTAGAGYSVVIATPANRAPAATDDFYGMNQASSLSVPAPGVLANDSDSDEDPLTVELVSGPANAASFQLNPDGSFSYMPPPYFFGEDSFIYRVSDGTATSETATVHVTVSQPGSQGFITGGGKIFQDGRKCTFGFVAKVQGNGVQGNLEFQDHDASMDVRSQVMQVVYAANSSDGYFGGTCTVNGAAGYTFFVQIHDRGEPGRNDDLTIWVFDSLNNTVYTAGALLSGGNIVIHGH